MTGRIGEDLQVGIQLLQGGVGTFQLGASLQDCPFGIAAGRNIAKDKNYPEERAVGVADGGGAIVDGNLTAVVGEQNGMVGQTRDGAQAHHFLDGILNNGARIFIDDAEHPRKRDAETGLARPTRELLRHRIHEGNAAFPVRYEDGVADACERGLETIPGDSHFLPTFRQLANE